MCFVASPLHPSPVATPLTLPSQPFLLHLELGTSWMADLSNRTVLVVSPFNESIRHSLILGGRAIWGARAHGLMPDGMRVKLVKPPVNIGGVRDAAAGWQGSLQALIAAVDAAGPFDVALLSCGGLGMLLAAHLRATHRSAIYMGGAMQLLFGVRGKRWNSMPAYKEAMANPNWRSPMLSERPPKLNDVENGAYW